MCGGGWEGLSSIFRAFITVMGRAAQSPGIRSFRASIERAFPRDAACTHRNFRGNIEHFCGVFKRMCLVSIAAFIA